MVVDGYRGARLPADGRNRSVKVSSTFRRARVATLAAALVTTVSLAGCGSASPNTAAVVDGRVIPESAIVDAVHDAALSGVGTRMTPQAALVSLMAQPFVVDALKKKGTMVTGKEAVAQVFPTLKDPSEATSEIAQVSVGISKLDQTEQQAVVDAMGKADVTVNPRYGTFDPQRLLVTSEPNWLVATPTASASN